MKILKTLPGIGLSLVIAVLALWLESLQQGCEEVKAMFGVDLSVDWRVNPVEQEITRAEEVAADES